MSAAFGNDHLVDSMLYSYGALGYNMESDDSLRARVRYVVGTAPALSGKMLEAVAALYGLKRRDNTLKIEKIRYVNQYLGRWNP